jgi:acetyl esterase/lipase
MNQAEDQQALPGQDLVEQGLADLSQDRVSEASLLVLIAAPRLRRLGIPVPNRPLPRSCEHDLYARLDERLGAAAHSYYNSLIRRIVSFARALEREQSRR